MKTFHGLFDLDIVHDYYLSLCPDLDVVPTARCRKVMQMGRIVAKVGDGGMKVFFEGDETRTPTISMVGETLTFALRLRNYNFSNFTALPVPSAMLRYKNKGSDELVGDPVLLVPAVFRHRMKRNDLPIYLVVRDRQGRGVVEERYAIAPADGFSCDLTGYHPGPYAVEETGTGGTTVTAYHVDGELAGGNTFGLVEIEVTAAQYQQQAAYTVSYTAKEETLRYYVVAKKFTAAELGAMAVTDDDGKVIFQKGTAGTLVANLQQMEKEADILVFASEAPVKRREKGRDKIQLTKNGEVLVKHLPQPGQERLTGDIVIHISKR